MLARDIKLSHTVFALPFALLGMVLAAGWADRPPRLGEIALILLCMVLARSTAMIGNRWIDARLDAVAGARRDGGAEHVARREHRRRARHRQRPPVVRLLDPPLHEFLPADESEIAGLADRTLMATEFPDLDLWHPAELEIGDLAARARAIEDAGRALDGITNSEGASASEDAAVGVYANSHGFVGSRASTRYGQNCILVAGSGGGMQRDWWWDRKRRQDALDAPEHTGRHAAERTLARLGARRVPTGRVPVLFTPEAAGSLIGHLVGAVSGGNLYRRTSFLVDALDTALFPEWVHIAEHPREPGGPRSAAFDQEGVATREAPLINAGVLERFVLDSYSGRRLRRETTANAGGVRNLRLEPGGKSRTELVGDMGRGLVVTEMMGQGVNLVTGDYSRGASGFWVENGEIAHPVEEITIAGHLGEMFAGLSEAGSDLEDRSNIQVPSLLVDSLMVGGD